VKQILLFLGMAIGLILTNPNHATYETYATEQIAELAKEQCNQVPRGYVSLFHSPCRTAIEIFKPELRLLVAAHTQRQNWYLVSIYRSEIVIPGVKSNVAMESIGVLNNFYTYKK
jgi:Domain of unknown function (DUF4359)